MDITVQRKGMYEFISRLFIQEMDENMLAKIEKLKNFKDFFPEYYEWDKRHKMSRYKLINEVLNVDFTDIAIMHLIPYETFYTREDGMIESGGANEVVDIYNRYGFRVDLDKARVVSPDHIGVELEFMKNLIELEANAIEDEDFEYAKRLKNEQKDFLKEHILKFAPMYLINVAEQARTPFYKDAAKLALEFLLEDYEWLCSKV